MPLVDRLARDLTASMKAQDAARTSVLRMAKAALQNREIEKGGPLDDAEVIKLLQGLVKQREDSIEQFRRGGRDDLVRKEQAEIDVLRGYLPQDASEDEIASAVERAVAETGAVSARDLGKVMKAALAALGATGKTVDGRRVNEAARKRLGG
jgi:hypothetical protein